MSDIFEPAVAHRFLVSCFFSRVPSPVDFRFQRVSGLARQMQTSGYREGGNNVGSVHFPERVTHDNLVLERGVMVATPLTVAFADVMSRFRSHYTDVVVLLLNHRDVPISTWTFTNALPVAWRTGDLDATASQVLIDTLELAYQEVHWMGAKG